ncbi:hypothetical protein R8Z50_33530 [Longispora sp. K20-0274]|uniref:hypothetical protein n=1 Tax=Longispora sp. K20-0274 TaxID=3088255 RepID=UPI003999D2C5
MAALHLVTVGVALTTLAATPIVIAWLVVRADDLAGYAGDVMDRLPGQEPTPRHPPIEETAAELRRITEALRAPVSVAAEIAELEQSERESVELERLARQLELDSEDVEIAAPSEDTLHRAALWRAELRREALWISYDEQLREACRALGVPQQLDSVVGVELELERLRVTDELAQAGLTLPV